MQNGIGFTRCLVLAASVVTVTVISGPADAQDDGARAYWKGRSGTNVVSFQYLDMHLDASDSVGFDPANYIYPAADVDAGIFIANYARHMTLFDRPASLMVNVVGGGVEVNFDVSLTPLEFLPPGVDPDISFSQSASGYADPTVQLDINLFGTPPLIAGFDQLNYEPTWTLDVALMLGVPIGEYDSNKVVNLGLNRNYGRIAFPFKYHFGVFAPGYMRSLEIIPSVWLFGENDDFVGQKLDNEPLYQVEAHWTQDFTPTFFGSIDLLYRKGFQSEINGVDLGGDIEIGNIGATLNFQVTDNLTLRASFSSNVFGNSDIDSSMVRIQFVYAWHRVTENMKRL